MVKTMQILSFLLFMIYSAVVTKAQTMYVMSIGVSKYADSNNNLTQTTKDAKSFRDIMSNHTDKITLLTSSYANRENVLKKLNSLSKLAKEDDKLIIFYSGHGYPGGIYPYDEPISYQEINDILKSSKAKEKICIFNACNTGSVSDVKGETQMYKAPTSGNIIYIMSSRADEFSYEHPIAGHCIFTAGMLKGLRGKADANNDKKITVSELFNYVYNDVVHTTKSLELSQHPQLIGVKSVTDAVIVDWNNK